MSALTVINTVENLARLLVFAALGWWRLRPLLTGSASPHTDKAATAADWAIVAAAFAAAAGSAANVIGLSVPAVRHIFGPLSAATAALMLCAIALYFAAINTWQRFYLPTLALLLALGVIVTVVMVATGHDSASAAAAFALTLVAVPACVMTIAACLRTLARPGLHRGARIALLTEIGGMTALTYLEAVSWWRVVSLGQGAIQRQLSATIVLLTGTALAILGVALVPLTEYVRKLLLARRMHAHTADLSIIHTYLLYMYPKLNQLAPLSLSTGPAVSTEKARSAAWLIRPNTVIADAYALLIEIRDGLLWLSPTIAPEHADDPATIAHHLTTATDNAAIVDDFDLTTAALTAAESTTPQVLLPPHNTDTTRGDSDPFFAECNALAPLAAALTHHRQ